MPVQLRTEQKPVKLSETEYCAPKTEKIEEAAGAARLDQVVLSAKLTRLSTQVIPGETGRYDLTEHEERIDTKQDAVSAEWSRYLEMAAQNSRIAAMQAAVKRHAAGMQIDWDILLEWEPSADLPLSENIRALAVRYQLLKELIRENFGGEEQLELLSRLELLLSAKMEKLYQHLLSSLYDFWASYGQQDAADKTKPSLKRAVYEAAQAARGVAAKAAAQPEKTAYRSEQAHDTWGRVPATQQAAAGKTGEAAEKGLRKDFPDGNLSSSRTADFQKQAQTATQHVKNAPLSASRQTPFASFAGRAAGPVPQDRGASPSAKADRAAFTAGSGAKGPGKGALFSPQELELARRFAAQIGPVLRRHASEELQSRFSGLEAGMLSMKTEVFAGFSGVGRGVIDAMRAAVDRYLYRRLSQGCDLQQGDRVKNEQQTWKNMLAIGRKMLEAFQKTGSARDAVLEGLRFARHLGDEDAFFRLQKGAAHLEAIQNDRDRPRETLRRELLLQARDNWNEFVCQLGLAGGYVPHFYWSEADARAMRLFVEQPRLLRFGTLFLHLLRSLTLIWLLLSVVLFFLLPFLNAAGFLLLLLLMNFAAAAAANRKIGTIGKSRRI